MPHAYIILSFCAFEYIDGAQMEWLDMFIIIYYYNDGQ